MIILWNVMFLKNQDKKNYREIIQDGAICTEKTI